MDRPVYRHIFGRSLPVFVRPPARGTVRHAQVRVAPLGVRLAEAAPVRPRPLGGEGRLVRLPGLRPLRPVPLPEGEGARPPAPRRRRGRLVGVPSPLPVRPPEGLPPEARPEPLPRPDRPGRPPVLTRWDGVAWDGSVTPPGGPVRCTVAYGHRGCPVRGPVHGVPGSVPGVETDPPAACGCGRGPVAFRATVDGRPAGYCCRECAADPLFREEASVWEMSDGDTELARLWEVMSS